MVETDFNASLLDDKVSDAEDVNHIFERSMYWKQMRILENKKKFPSNEWNFLSKQLTSNETNSFFLFWQEHLYL